MNIIPEVVIHINTNKCMARKNQKNAIRFQCPNDKKYGDFCGKHKNYESKNLVRIDQNLDSDRITRIDNDQDCCKTNKNMDDSEIGKPVGNYCDCDEYEKGGLKTLSYSELSKKSFKKYYYNTTPSYPLTILDYLVDMELNRSATAIKKSCKYYQLKSSKELKKTEISEQKTLLRNFFNTYLKCVINYDKIIFLQRKIKQWQKNSKIKFNGPAVYNRKLCNNQTDFYSFDDIKDIPAKYFFSFRDKDNFVYGFHIESFIQLINESAISKNPYNRCIIKNDVKKRAKQLWNLLQKKNMASRIINFDLSNDIKLRVKQKCLSTFQKIDLFGYQTDINWICGLTTYRLKNLARYLINYWQHKAGFSNELKNRILPNQELFTFSEYRQINNQINKYCIMELIIGGIDKLVSLGVSNDDKNMGCIMTLMALNDVTREVGQVNPWLR